MGREDREVRGEVGERRDGADIGWHWPAHTAGHRQVTPGGTAGQNGPTALATQQQDSHTNCRTLKHSTLYGT